MSSLAEDFSRSATLSETQIFTPQYAHDHADDADDSLSYPSQHAHAATLQRADGDAFDEEDEDGAGAALDQLDDEQLLSDDSRRGDEEYEEDRREAEESPNALEAAAKLTAQDYIPKRLVGYTYTAAGNEAAAEPWHLPRPAAPLSLLPYTKTGGNGIFEVRPAVVHFAGFHTGQSYTQQVSIVNVSGVSQRLHILPLESNSAFTVSYNKLGRVAPGMAETLSIRFEPAAYRYYTDAIRVHVRGENLLIPIHAYPTLNAQNHVFPSTINMCPTPSGSVGVGRRVSKRVEIVCDVPVQFEYELTLQQATTDFSVFPMKGIVPANGSVTMTIDYSPKRPVTSSVQLLISLSQFNFKPFLCTLTGRAHVLQLDLPKEKSKPVQSLRQKRLAAAGHLTQLHPTPAGAAAAVAAAARRTQAAAAPAAASERPRAAGVKK